MVAHSRGMPTLEGKWTAPLLSGGAPPAETCINNPQFAIYPSVENATYHIEFVRQDLEAKFRFGAWVMKGEKLDGRMTDFVGMVEKTNLSTSERRSLSLQLPPRKGGLPYVAFAAPQDAGMEGSFTISVTSEEDPDVRVVSLNENVVGSAGAAAASGPGTQAGKKLDPFGAVPSTGAPAAPLSKMSVRDGPAPDNRPVVETIGQGLSRKLKDDANRAIETALSAASTSRSGKFEDPAFGPSDAALGAPAAALGVASWRRPDEIEPGFKLNLQNAEKVGLKMGTLENEWLVGALNVVGGTPGVTSRLFVDSSHAKEGFYLVRLWVEDPNSDDDWAVVTVDDRLPCAADGLPAFVRGAREGALWAAIVEKAVAKRYGSYSKLATVPPALMGGDAPTGSSSSEAVLRGLELVTGGKARVLEMAPDGLPTPKHLDALWQTLQECGATRM